MGRITRLSVKNYRSVKERVVVDFPNNIPVVFIGENNSGKSNIISALDLLLGETWPGNYELSDHEYFARIKENVPVKIQVDVENVVHSYQSRQHDVSKFTWCCSEPNNKNENRFYMTFSNGYENKYVSSETREQCLCIVIKADRRLSYQLSYSTKYTFLSKLMKRFHDKLTAEPERVARLKEYFENVKSIFDEVDSFSTFTKELNNKVLDLSDSLDYGLGTDFSAYDPSNYFHSLKVFPYQGTTVLNFDELGTGQEQILALSFVYAYAKAFHSENDNIILVIEEPEAHLHPLAQRWLSKKINDFANEGIQIVISTHSPAFINLENLDGLVLLYKVDGATRVRQLSANSLSKYCIEHGVPTDKTNQGNILNFYSTAATEEILSGFFARKIVLVEGPSESLALPVYFSKLGLDVTKEGIAIIPVHGKGNLSKWWRLFTAYSIPTYIIFDNDSEDDNDGKKREDILRTLGISGDDFPSIISENTLKIESEYTVFGKNFDITLKNIFGEEYKSLEEEVTKYNLSKRQSKPLIARFIAERMSYDDEDDRWKPLKQLAEIIQSILIVGTSIENDVLFY